MTDAVRCCSFLESFPNRAWRNQWRRLVMPILSDYKLIVPLFTTSTIRRHSFKIFRHIFGKIIPVFYLLITTRLHGARTVETIVLQILLLLTSYLQHQFIKQDHTRTIHTTSFYPQRACCLMPESVNYQIHTRSESFALFTKWSPIRLVANWKAKLSRYSNIVE